MQVDLYNEIDWNQLKMGGVTGPVQTTGIIAAMVVDSKGRESLHVCTLGRLQVPYVNNRPVSNVTDEVNRVDFVDSKNFDEGKETEKRPRTRSLSLHSEGYRDQKLSVSRYYYVLMLRAVHNDCMQIPSTVS